MMIISPDRWQEIVNSPDWDEGCPSPSELKEMAAIITMAGKLVARLDRFHPGVMAAQREAMKCWSPKDAEAIAALDNLRVEDRVA